jgi:hypothetical protein
VGKYDPLQDFFQHLPAQQDEIVLTFERIEKIIGASLPPDAYNPKGTWWNNTNDSRRPQARAWLIAGWKKTQVDREQKSVMFCRER